MKIWYIVTTSKSYQDEIFKSNTAPLLAETIVTDRNDHFKNKVSQKVPPKDFGFRLITTSRNRNREKDLRVWGQYSLSKKEAVDSESKNLSNSVGRDTKILAIMLTSKVLVSRNFPGMYILEEGPLYLLNRASRSS